ncbi:3400_t:CDS:10, partial [Entrophospora sp. SA101]
MDKFPERTLKSLTAISQHNMAESNKARADGDPNWWQIHEACLKAIGFVSNELISALNDKNLNIGINLGILFEQIIHQILNEPGRAFVFASQFASVLPGELTSGFIKAAIEAIKDPDGTIPVKVSALRALKSFCRNLNEQYVLPFQGTIIECVANLINVTTEDFLLLVLETLERAIKINRDVIFQYEGLIGPMVVDVWQKFPSEHLVMSAVNSISETLSINSTFIERALPALANIIMNPTIDSSHTESAIDLITSLIRGTTISPLPFVYIQHIFPPLIHLMLTTEERSILQSGEICLRYLVQKGCSQISEWYDLFKQKTASNNKSSELSPIQHLVASAEAGAITALFTNPFWVIKTRMCATNIDDPRAYKGLFDGLYQILKYEGIRGLYRGIIPAFFGVSHGALQFMAYEEMKKWKLKIGSKEDRKKL